MSPVTHFLTGWVLANSTPLGRRDRALVSWSVVVPDVDGLGIVVEVLTRNSSHPLLWCSQYHHTLHNLAFAIVVTVLARISHPFVRRPAGVPRARWRPVADPLPGAVRFHAVAELAWSMESECLAEFPDHPRFAGSDVVSGVAASMFATGDGFRACGTSLRERPARSVRQSCKLRFARQRKRQLVVFQPRLALACPGCGFRSRLQRCPPNPPPWNPPPPPVLNP